MSAETIVKQNLRGKLPMELPKTLFGCPICGESVHLTGVTEWTTEDGEIVGIEYDCETEPDIDSDDWEEWFQGHFSMPYVDWLPWETRLLTWLNERYFHLWADEEGRGDDGCCEDEGSI